MIHSLLFLFSNKMSMTTKREVKSEEMDTTPLKRRKVAETDPDRKDTLLKIPSELLHIVIGYLNRKDIITISSLSHSHRALVHGYLFEEVQLDWTQLVEFVKGFKHLNRIRKVSLDAKRSDLKATTKSEWNVSFKPMLEAMPQLEQLQIELVTSSRCLKYKDDIDEELSGKIKHISLKSMSMTNSGDANGEAMFELTQLQRFHDVEKLTLDGFSLSRDVYFHPKIQEDMSDSAVRKRDGKMTALREIELVNCQWEYPITLKDVFAPDYPLPSGVKASKNCAPERLALAFSNESSKFVESERFKMLVNNAYNGNFQYEVGFYERLRELELVVENDNYEANRFHYYYPRLHQLDLRRAFYTEEGGKQSILSNLRRLKLIGWHMLSARELDCCFELEDGLAYNMEHFELQVVSPQAQQGLERVLEDKLRVKFGHDKCHVVVNIIR